MPRRPAGSRSRLTAWSHFLLHIDHLQARRLLTVGATRATAPAASLPAGMILVSTSSPWPPSPAAFTLTVPERRTPEPGEADDVGPDVVVERGGD